VTDCRALVSRWLAGDLPSDDLKPGREDSGVFRVQGSSGAVILKLWAKPGWRGVARRLSRTSPMRRELRALQILGRAGLAVPGVIGWCDLTGLRSRWTEALLLEDLGECTRAMVHTRQLVEAGREQELATYMAEVLDLTEGVLRCGIIDTDHSMQNLVATPDGRAVRLDFEIARVAPLGVMSSRELGETLAHLIGSFAFAIQPEVHRATEFARQVQERLRPSRAVLEATSTEIRRMMQVQLEHSGIDTHVPLPWE
jgi:hypothetical protein